jgi:hypothetical protein
LSVLACKVSDIYDGLHRRSQITRCHGWISFNLLCGLWQSQIEFLELSFLQWISGFLRYNGVNVKFLVLRSF